MVDLSNQSWMCKSEKKRNPLSQGAIPLSGETRNIKEQEAEKRQDMQGNGCYVTIHKLA